MQYCETCAKPVSDNIIPIGSGEVWCSEECIELWQFAELSYEGCE